MTATISAFRGKPFQPPVVEAQRPSAPVAVLSSFTVTPDARHGWEKLWASIATRASTWPGCRTFQILSDRNDPMYGVVFSEWDSLEAYNAFTHHSRGTWMAQALSNLAMPGECRFLNIAGNETDREATTGS
jgi:heme-degrading monooxygenase HmoA